ncbi:hypothetical protein LTR70_009491 [Exophiala xenobiotica]|uniref:Alpha/beta hydrolase fold-3 domain-containing protein n=1 Tax=Lithohypha guttulata TaxID=1690604 RepID=A0ABR0JX44_9EURO|nr:hypothetical protein LTR24_009387 [Lithohypha guttulata]KAK5310423.1 hypothetical protein LTR70_009491 [Exophiala xenobiotica]
MCKQWKDEWRTDPGRIVLSGSSFGATIAILVSLTIALDGGEVLGLNAVVPVIDTDPEASENPWGENEQTMVLLPDGLISQLNQTFRGVFRVDTKDWRNNLSAMTGPTFKYLPQRTLMIFAAFDALLDTQMKWMNQVPHHEDRICLKVDAFHNVKDLYDTKAGREVWDATVAFYKRLEGVDEAYSSLTPWMVTTR